MTRSTFVEPRHIPVRDELGQAGFDTRRLSDQQVLSLARRLAELPGRRPAR
jgi:hypothetical protein